MKSEHTLKCKMIVVHSSDGYFESTVWSRETVPVQAVCCKLAVMWLNRQVSRVSQNMSPMNNCCDSVTLLPGPDPWQFRYG